MQATLDARRHRYGLRWTRVAALAIAALCAAPVIAQAPIFADVPDGHPFRFEIERFYHAGYTNGCASNPLRFCPDDPVTRGQAAVFLTREVRGVQTVPILYPTPLSDIAGHPFEAWISTAYTDGVVESTLNYDGNTPCTRGTTFYCPDVPLTRSEAAKAVIRAKYGVGYDPPDPVGVFDDLPTTDARAEWAEQMWADGIMPGGGLEVPIDRAIPPELLRRVR